METFKGYNQIESHFLGLDLLGALSSLLPAPVPVLTLLELQPASVCEGLFFPLNDHFPRPYYTPHYIPDQGHSLKEDSLQISLQHQPK